MELCHCVGGRQAAENQDFAFVDLIVGSLGRREYIVGKLCLLREKWREYIDPVIFLPPLTQDNSLKGLYKGLGILHTAEHSEQVLGISAGVRKRDGGSGVGFLHLQQLIRGNTEALGQLLGQCLLLDVRLQQVK